MRTLTRVGIASLLVGAIVSAPLSMAAAQDDHGGGPAVGDAGFENLGLDVFGFGGSGFGDLRGLFGRGSALDITGLVDGTKLVTFRSTSTRIRDSRDVQGLDGDQRLVGIDYRVQDGKLYGVGDAGGVYSIDEGGQATKVKQLTVALNGTNFGVDFNPAANALRIISDTGQNLRQPFADLTVPTATDTTLAYTAGTPATGITGAAYTNNDTDPNSATTLYDLDTTMDQIAIQSPANAGTLAPTGKLTVDAGPNAGFDIYSTVREGSAVAATGFATIQVDGQYGLYRVNLFTGKVQRIGTFSVNVSDLAIPLAQR